MVRGVGEVVYAAAKAVTGSEVPYKLQCGNAASSTKALIRMVRSLTAAAARFEGGLLGHKRPSGMSTWSPSSVHA
jgi:hypothetical protein